METKVMKLTDEYKEKLRNSLGFGTKSTFKYVPKDYRDADVSKEYWPIWSLTTKDGVDVAEIEDESGELVYNEDGLRKVNFKSGAHRIKTLSLGIESVKNFLQINGELISYTKSSETLVIIKENGNKEVKENFSIKEFIRYIPVSLQIELQEAINSRKALTKEELLGLE